MIYAGKLNQGASPVKRVRGDIVARRVLLPTITLFL
jgi:hypothetical protein